jgi:hypothetical protein
MASLPVGKNYNPWPRLSQNPCHFQPILPRIFDAPIWNIERSTPHRSQNLGSIGSFASAIFGRTARTHFALREIEDAGPLPALRGFQHRSAAGLLYVVAVGCDG